MFPHLTTKEHPCHIYSDSMPSKQIIIQTIMYHRATSSFKVKAWRHNTLNNTMSPWAWCSSPPSTQKLPCNNLQWSITQSFLPQICIALGAVFKLGQKCRGWGSFNGERSFARLWHQIITLGRSSWGKPEWTAHCWLHNHVAIALHTKIIWQTWAKLHTQILSWISVVYGLHPYRTLHVKLFRQPLCTTLQFLSSMTEQPQSSLV